MKFLLRRTVDKTSAQSRRIGAESDVGSEFEFVKAHA